MPWELPQALWERLHEDSADPYEGKVFFILVVLMSVATLTATTECLHSIFATHSLPKVSMTDNDS